LQVPARHRSADSALLSDRVALAVARTDEAVPLNREVRGKRMFAVHWSTFDLAYHDCDEPIRGAVAKSASTRR
jgi:hypothetical protein